MDILVRNCHGSKMYHYSTISECEKTTSIYPSQGRFGNIPGPLRPHTHCSFVSPGCHIPPFWNIFTSGFFYTSWITKHSTSSATGGRWFFAMPYFLSRKTLQAHVLCQQASGRLVLGKCPFVPDSLVVAYGALLFHKESPRSIFFASSYDSGERQKQTFRVYQQTLP